MARCLFLAAIIICLAASTCHARLRFPFEDETVVTRSDLIVIAAVKPDSLQYFPHTSGPGAGESWEYHAVLIISEILKGESKELEIPLTIDYGLGPRTDQTQLPSTRPITTKAPLEIIDTASGGSFSPIVPDALQNNIWLLRLDKDGQYHVTDPEDLQPIFVKDYLMCYLAKDPENAVRSQLQRQPEIVDRAMRYLTHCEVQRIAKEPDAAVRVERLVPYFQLHQWWNGHYEAQDELEKCGQIAGAYLIGLFESHYDPQLRIDITNIWRKTKYAPAGKILTKTLADDNRYWTAQKSPNNWQKDDSDAQIFQMRRDKYQSENFTVWTLGELETADARATIEETRRYWAIIPSDKGQMAKLCDDALAKLNSAPSK